MNEEPRGTERGYQRELAEAGVILLCLYGFVVWVLYGPAEQVLKVIGR